MRHFVILLIYSWFVSIQSGMADDLAVLKQCQDTEIQRLASQRSRSTPAPLKSPDSTQLQAILLRCRANIAVGKILQLAGSCGGEGDCGFVDEAPTPPESGNSASEDTTNRVPDPSTPQSSGKKGKK